MRALNSTHPARRTKASVAALLIGLAILAAGMTTPPAATASIGPKVVKATKNKGVRTIGNLKVGPLGGANQPLTFADVKAAVGPPKRLKKDGACLADYGAGMSLLFVSFGGATNCNELFLQGAEITGKKWRVEVGRKVYRKGMKASRIPQGSKRFPGLGYRLATMPFIGTRTGSVYAMAGSKGRISKISLFIGGAGD